jgi:TolB-like protein/Tfp pilus assembly protein PilF
VTKHSQAIARSSQTPLPTDESIRAQVEKILSARAFSRSPRLTRFLTFTVEQTLDGHSEQLKEQTIGMEVFDRGAHYDPRIDPIVRVEARRLRSRLKDYYTSSGRRDEVLIAFPKGAYIPVFRDRRSSPVAAKRIEPLETSVAVLPFSNLTPGAGDDYFSDGLTEELIHRLTRIEGLRVVAWGSASRLRGHEEDLTEVRRQLKVGAVLRGRVRRTETRVRVTAQLIDTESGSYLWTEAYDSELKNIFAIQEEMARAIADALQLRLGTPPSTGLTRKTLSVESYNLCLQGRFHANKRTADGFRKSIACYRQAIAADEISAEAYAGLADAFSLQADYGLADPVHVVPQARSAAERALAIDPQSAEANASLAYIRSLFDWDWEPAGVLYRRAIALNPGYARAHHWFGLDYLALLGRLDEALAEVQLAHRLDPLSQIVREGYGYIHILRREYSSALKILHELNDLDPTFYKAYSALGRLYHLMGNYDESIAMLERALEVGGPIPNIVAALAQVLALAKRKKESRAYLEKLESMQRTQWVPTTSFAVVHLGTGDYAKSLDFLEAACERRERGVTWLKVHPLYDPLRSEPRFGRLLERVGFLP